MEVAHSIQLYMLHRTMDIPNLPLRYTLIHKCMARSNFLDSLHSCRFAGVQEKERPCIGYCNRGIQSLPLESIQGNPVVRRQPLAAEMQR